MARKFVSPGVFTQEIDKSYLAQGVASIGAGVIGATVKGPAFDPTPVSDFNEFVARFGDVHPTKVMPYAAKNYLKNSNLLNVVRVLGSRDGSDTATNGDTTTAYAIVDASLTASAILIAKGDVTATLAGAGLNMEYSFVSGSTVYAAGTASAAPTANNYFGNMFNADPTKINQFGHFLYKNFKWHGTGSGGPFTLVELTAAPASGVFDADYASAITPWITSQPFGGQAFNLFRLHAISAGNASNTDVKASITSIRPSPYPAITKFGTFDLEIRTFGDTDARLVQIESYSNLSLDPTSPNYLPRVIGDQYTSWNSTTRKNVVNGQYVNRSKYVRVEMGDGGQPDIALPWGHTGYPECVPAGGTTPDVPFIKNNLDSNDNVSPSTFFGLDFSQDNVEDRLSWTLKSGSSFNPATSNVAAGSKFSLTHLSGALLSGTYYASYETASSGTYPDIAPVGAFDIAAQAGAQRGFTVAFCGGFDGWSPTQADPLAAAGPADSVATIALKLAVETLSNPDEIDLNLLAIPGIVDPNVNGYARAMCNSRADVLMIMDIVNSASVGSVTQAISKINTMGVDDNYAATYYPALRYADTTNNVEVTVPPSVAVLGAFAFSDRVGQVFFAPAGLTRGGLLPFGIVGVCDHLTFQDRNDLYEARINPIAIFPNEGINVFGQKTLQARPSALDRINVRRLLIYAKKTIASVAKVLLFEPNNPATWQRFLSTVNPILEKIRQDQGIERFKVVMDSTTNTADLIDRNIMTGKIFLQPTRAAEYIDLSFIITASGVSFEE